MKLILLLSSLAIAEGRFFDWLHSHHGHGYDNDGQGHGDEDGRHRHGHGHGHHGHHGNGNGNTNQDTCSSVVAGRNARPPISVRESDCSSFLTETVTPETITITTTSTINSLPLSMQSLTIPASQPGGSIDPIPTYAISACSDNVSLYSLACSVLGISDMGTITAETPTATAVSFISFSPTARPTAVPTTTTSVIPAVSSSAIAVTPDYIYLGCYTEANDMNPLNGPTLVNYVSMTYAECFSFCTPTYRLYGLGNGGECFCGTALNPGSMSVASTDCYTPCAGDLLETCGASNRFSIFGTSAAASKISSMIVFSTTSKAAISSLEFAISSTIAAPQLPPSSVTSSSSETTPSSTSLSTSSSMLAAVSSSSQSSSTSITSTSSVPPADSLPSLFVSTSPSLTLSTSSSTTSVSTTQTSSIQSSFITSSSSPSSFSISSISSSSTTTTSITPGLIIPALPSTSTSSAASSANTTAPNLLNRCANPLSCTTTTACSEDHTCLCQPSVEGVGYCLADMPCSSLMDCNVDADCGAGSACMVTCCSSNKCLDAEFLCPNQDTPASLFRKGGLGAAVGVGGGRESAVRREDVEEWTNHLPESGMSSPPRNLEEEFVRRWGGGL